MVERFLWHPVLTSAELGHTPLGVSLLGQSVVLWRELRRGGPDTQVHAWADHCPHRGAKLSLGKSNHELGGLMPPNSQRPSKDIDCHADAASG